MVVIPLTEQQEQAIAAAALPLGVETWELAVHILAGIQRAHLHASSDTNATPSEGDGV